MTETRIPKHKKAIEKHDKIIEKGFFLMCKKGFHNVSTPDIARSAEVSTGILYQYFEDKRAIFVEGVRRYSADILYPLLYIEIDNVRIDNIDSLIKGIIHNFTNNCINNIDAHRELIAMSHSDKEVAAIINNLQSQLIKKIVTLLQNNNFKIDNITEKVHLTVSILGTFCRSLVLNKQEYLDYDVMHNNIVDVVSNILV